MTAVHHMLRIDSLPFVLTALGLVAVMRASPRWGRVAYALASLAAYLLLSPDLGSLVLSLAFLYWPYLLVRFKRPLPSGAVTIVAVVQTTLLVWSKKYLLVAGGHDVSWLREALTIVGVSYIILRQIELITWLDAEPDTPLHWLDYTAFMVGLYTLLAGPIVTYRDFVAGFGVRQQETPRSFLKALDRVFSGYIKVSLLSPFVYELSSLSHLEAHPGWPARLAFFYLFPWYIYLNFSGYCDVVIGFGRLTHIALPENFERPFLATSIQNYWQRWHITFSTWIRAHLFFPLMRALRGLGRFSTPASLFLTFVIVGLWHGTDPGFLVFGVLHGLAVAAAPLSRSIAQRALGEAGFATYETHWAARAAQTLVTYHYLCFTMLFFERPLAQVWHILGL